MQDQLAIANRNRCFLLFIRVIKKLYVEEILRDRSLWETKMLPKLTKFHQECLEPEIILNRGGRMFERQFFY